MLSRSGGVPTHTVKTGQGIRWGIAKPSNYLIGSCGFTWNEGANAAEVGYELASQFWKQGIMSEALYAILNYAFGIKKVKFVTAEIMLENLASRRLLEKLGFQSQEKHHQSDRYIF